MIPSHILLIRFIHAFHYLFAITFYGAILFLILYLDWLFSLIDLIIFRLASKLIQIII